MQINKHESIEPSGWVDGKCERRGVGMAQHKSIEPSNVSVLSATAELCEYANENKRNFGLHRFDLT
jgi:hypothetical protein